MRLHLACQNRSVAKIGLECGLNSKAREKKVRCRRRERPAVGWKWFGKGSLGPFSLILLLHTFRSGAPFLVKRDVG